MSKFLRIVVSALVALTGAVVFTPGVAMAGVGAGATPTFPQDLAIGGVRVGEVYSASIEMTNFNTSPDTASLNTVCNFGDTAPPCTPSTSTALQEDPGINLVLSCGVLGNDSICATAGIDAGVFQLEGAAVGRAGTECDGTAFSVSTTDPTLGTLRFEPTDGSNVTLVGQLATCVIDFDYRVLRVPSIDSDPSTAGVQTIQITDNVQWLAGSNINASARGTTQGTTVLRAIPSISTTASATVQLGNGTITDTALVSDRESAVAGAMITFSAYGPNDPSCTGTPAFTSTVSQPIADGPVTSEAFTPTAQGTYRWIAVYSGDANNEPASGACNDANESVVVTPAQPTITTEASAEQPLGAGTLTDTATVSGRVGAVAGGTVTFNLFGPDDATCATSIFNSTVDISATSDTVTSAGYTPTAPGNYRWIASYSGDTNNLPVSGECGDANEDTDVNPAQPAITTDAGDDIAVGGELTDTATVTGRVSPLASTVDFRLYGPNDAECSGTPAFESLGVELAPTVSTVTSEGFTPEIAGTYRWVATYNGDANNASATGVCGDPAETVEVLLGNPTIATQTSPGVVAGEGEVFDTAIVSGRIQPQEGATIDFRLYAPGDTECERTPVFESLGVAYPVAGGSVRSASFTPTVAGTYRWIATYSGDANNVGVSGECGESTETFVVTINPEVELPATGAETDMLLRSGAGIALAGLAMMLLGRRRRPLIGA
ncbi:MAG: LPXTG cell wall anchor domain-containing protein [Ilumatobacter sp.]